MMKKIIKEKLKNTIWMTYRYNFKPLLRDICTQDQIHLLQSDSGWGCMVRTGQNIFAEGLRRHLGNQIQTIHHIIQQFADDDNDSPDLAPYSIQKIAKVAYDIYRILPGQWYQPNRICYCLEKLHSQNPMKTCEKLQVMTLSCDVPIILENILKRFCGHDAKICQ